MHKASAIQPQTIEPQIMLIMSSSVLRLFLKFESSASDLRCTDRVYIGGVQNHPSPRHSVQVRCLDVRIVPSNIIPTCPKYNAQWIDLHSTYMRSTIINKAISNECTVWEIAVYHVKRLLSFSLQNSLQC